MRGEATVRAEMESQNEEVVDRRLSERASETEPARERETRSGGGGGSVPPLQYRQYNVVLLKLLFCLFANPIISPAQGFL